MEIPKVLKRDLGRHDHVNIYPFSDIHLGSEYADIRKVKESLKAVADDPNGYILLIGDMLDMALKNSISNVYTATLTPQGQVESAVELLEPVKHKILAATEGNHEARMIRDVGYLPINSIIARLGIDVGAVYSIGAFVLFLSYKGERDRTISYSLYCKHGSGGGRMVGGKANKLAQMKEDVVADIYISAHTHQEMAFPTMICEADNRRRMVIPRPALHINSGSFLRWGGYAVEKGFPPSVTGAPTLKLWTERIVSGKTDRTIKRSSVTITV